MARFPIDLARRMIAIDSVTSRGTLDLARFCAETVLVGTDLQISLRPGDGPTQVNLLGVKGLGTLPPILLNSHLDTVPAGDPSLWSECGGDPFSARLSGDRLFGLGAADAKLDWLCKALALGRFVGRRFSRGVILAGTFGEECGLRGARALTSCLPERPAAAFAGEPTELRLVTRHKGLLVVTVTARDSRRKSPAPTLRFSIRGRAAHSSAPQLGDNAIRRALRLAREHGLRIAAIEGGDAANKVPAECSLEVVRSPAAEGLDRSAGLGRIGEGNARPLSEELQDFLCDLAAESDEIVSRSTSDPSFSPPTLTSNLGRIRAAGDGGEVTLDFRCLPADRPRAIVDRLEGFLTSIRSARGVEVSLAVERNNPALDAAPDSPAVSWSLATLAELGLSTELCTKAGCTEAGVYAAAGIPSVVFGPGRASGNTHAPNEHVSVCELEQAVELYARLVEKVCLG